MNLWGERVDLVTAEEYFCPEKAPFQAKLLRRPDPK